MFPRAVGILLGERARRDQVAGHELGALLAQAPQVRQDVLAEIVAVHPVRKLRPRLVGVFGTHPRSGEFTALLPAATLIVLTAGPRSLAAVVTAAIVAAPMLAVPAVFAAPMVATPAVFAAPPAVARPRTVVRGATVPRVAVARTLPAAGFPALVPAAAGSPAFLVVAAARVVGFFAPAIVSAITARTAVVAAAAAGSTGLVPALPVSALPVAVLPVAATVPATAVRVADVTVRPIGPRPRLPVPWAIAAPASAVRRSPASVLPALAAAAPRESLVSPLSARLGAPPHRRISAAAVLLRSFSAPLRPTVA